MKTQLLLFLISFFWILFLFPVERSIAQSNPKNTLDAAKELVEKSDWAGSVELLNRHLATYPGDTSALLLRAQARIQLMDLEGALVDYSDVLTRYSDQATALQGRGDLFFELGQLEQGIQDWMDFLFIASVEQKDLAYYKMGMGYLELRMYDDAVDLFDMAISLREDEPDYHAQKGMAFSRVGENMQAIEAFEKALSLDPSHNTSRNGLAMVLSGSDPELLRQIEETIADSSANSQTYKQRGFYRMNNQDEAGALADFSKAIEADAEDPENFYYRAVVYSRLKKWKEADADFTKALQLNPKNPEMILARGQARYRASELLGALEDFTRLIELDGEHASGFFHRGITLQRLGKLAEACVELHKAAELGMIQTEEVIAKVCEN